MAMGQTHVHSYLAPLLERVQGKGNTNGNGNGNGNGKFDPTHLITHRVPLEDAPDAYDLFNNEKGECVKVVLKP